MSEYTVCPVVRVARQGDIPALISLLEKLFSIESDFKFDPQCQERGLKMLLGDERSVILVAEYGGAVAGMCTVQVVISTAEGGYAGLVEDVVVSEACRGRGIGSALLAAAERWASIRGLRRLQLLADRENSPALSFYRRNDWSSTRLVCLRRIPAETVEQMPCE